MYNPWPDNPSILTPEEMEQLHIEDDSTAEASAGEDDSIGTRDNAHMVGAAAGTEGDPQPSSSSSVDREEEKRRRNREAARKGREKGAKRQADVKQEVLNLQSEQTRLKYELVQQVNELKKVIELAEKHRGTCNLRYTCNIPAIPSNVADLPDMANVTQETRNLAVIVCASGSMPSTSDVTFTDPGGTQLPCQHIRETSRKRNSEDVCESKPNTTADKRLKKQLQKRIDDLKRTKTVQILREAVTAKSSLSASTVGQAAVHHSVGDSWNGSTGSSSSRPVLPNTVIKIPEGIPHMRAYDPQNGRLSAGSLNTPLQLIPSENGFPGNPQPGIAHGIPNTTSIPQLNIEHHTALNTCPSTYTTSKSLPQTTSIILQGTMNITTAHKMDSMPNTLPTVQKPSDEIDLQKLVNEFRFRRQGQQAQSDDRTFEQNQMEPYLFTSTTHQQRTTSNQSQGSHTNNPIDVVPQHPVFTNIPNWDEIAGDSANRLPQSSTTEEQESLISKDAAVKQIKRQLKEDTQCYQTPLTVLNTFNAEIPSTTFASSLIEPLQFDMTGLSHQDWGIASSSTSEIAFLNVQHRQEGTNGNDLGELIASSMQSTQNITFD